MVWIKEAMARERNWYHVSSPQVDMVHIIKGQKAVEPAVKSELGLLGDAGDLFGREQISFIAYGICAGWCEHRKNS